MENISRSFFVAKREKRPDCVRLLSSWGRERKIDWRSVGKERRIVVARVFLLCFLQKKTLMCWFSFPDIFLSGSFALFFVPISSFPGEILKIRYFLFSPFYSRSLFQWIRNLGHLVGKEEKARSLFELRDRGNKKAEYLYIFLFSISICILFRRGKRKTEKLRKVEKPLISHKQIELQQLNQWEEAESHLHMKFLFFGSNLWPSFRGNT